MKKHKRQAQTRNNIEHEKEGKTWISIASKKCTAKEQTLLVQQMGNEKPETK